MDRSQTSVLLWKGFLTLHWSGNKNVIVLPHREKWGIQLQSMQQKSSSNREVDQSRLLSLLRQSKRRWDRYCQRYIQRTQAYNPLSFYHISCQHLISFFFAWKLKKSCQCCAILLIVSPLLMWAYYDNRFSIVRHFNIFTMIHNYVYIHVFMNWQQIYKRSSITAEKYLFVWHLNI